MYVRRRAPLPTKLSSGDIDDMSSVYADVIGQGGIEAINMAITDLAERHWAKKSPC